jgi:hypothetical protein
MRRRAKLYAISLVLYTLQVAGAVIRASRSSTAARKLGKRTDRRSKGVFDGRCCWRWQSYSRCPAVGRRTVRSGKAPRGRRRKGG